ncbi:hypothetical protein TCAL_11344 [Tigriopus californicus]|uniref:Uncharacterized protein n=1 Tax=Tigriopus californicus TaxID=6832 RepID=A0A553P8G1_TIGCA|nr:hypothetical protein TCAL_11344 [Tigriopus californicus]|eukprot:TCALIF_11344-PA protein Name:"Protein of unknown function" AED:0.02 eAED:0.02 QI:84/1/0.5/1/1/1/2/0/112
MFVMPLLEVGLVLIQNMEKALLYFTLAVISGLFVSMSCLCGHWVALKLAPNEERNNFYVPTMNRGQVGSYVDRVMVDNAKFELQDREREMMIDRKLLKERNGSWVFVRETLV